MLQKCNAISKTTGMFKKTKQNKKRTNMENDDAPYILNMKPSPVTDGPLHLCSVLIRCFWGYHYIMLAAPVPAPYYIVDNMPW